MGRWGGGDEKTHVFAFRVSCFISKSQRQREREREREVRIAREDTFYYLMNVDSGEHLSIDMSKIVRKELQIEENQVT